MKCVEFFGGCSRIYDKYSPKKAVKKHCSGMQCFFRNSRQIEGDRLLFCTFRREQGKWENPGERRFPENGSGPFTEVRIKSSSPMYGEIKCESQLTVDIFIIPELLFTVNSLRQNICRRARASRPEIG